MTKYYLQLTILFFAIFFSFLLFSSLIKHDIIEYEQKNELTKIKNYIENFEKNLNENISHYILYDHFIFKPFNLAILDKYHNIIYSDFKNTDFKNSNDFYSKKIIIDNENYTYIFNLNDYINYLNESSYWKGIIVYNNKTYPETALNPSQDKYELRYNDLLFYILSDSEFKRIFSDKIFLFFIFDSIFFALLALLMKKHYYYIINDIKSLTFFSQNPKNSEIKLNITESLLLKENIYKLQKNSDNKDQKILDLEKYISELKAKSKELIDEFIFSIKNPLQNLVDILTFNLSKDFEKNTIIKNISELSNIIDKFENIEIIEKIFPEKENLEFFDIHYFHKKLLYFLSYYLNNKKIKIIENISIKKTIIFTNKEKLYKALYEIFILLLKNKKEGLFEIFYTTSRISNKHFLEIKIIDKNNIFNDYILLLNSSSSLDYYNIESYSISLIRKYIKDLNGNIFLNQIESDVIIKLNIPIDYIELIKNYDFNNLKNYYLTALIERKYSLNQANTYLKEIINMYIQVLKNPYKNDVDKLKYHLFKNNFELMENWLEYILENYNDNNIISFKNILIKKLGSI